MSTRKDKQSKSWIFAEVVAIFTLWLLLIVLKTLGVVSWHWAVVLSGIVWIPLIWFTLTAVLVLMLYGLAKLKRIRRRRKNDRRIIRQAKAAGVWDKNPIVLGGRTLELKAWELYKIKRRPGEKDIELRKRCMTAAYNEYAEQIAKVYDYETAKAKRRREK